MLSHLSIRDLAIIESLEVSFEAGLNVLTGETGAGKSIILGAVGLLMGVRAQTDLVRQGAEEATVTGVLDLEGATELREYLAEHGLGLEPEVILGRVIARNGRSRAFVNNRPVTLAVLSEIGTRLLSISGQHEAQRLLRAEEHLLLVDAFGGLLEQRSQVGRAFRAYRGLADRLSDLRAREAGRAERVALLNFQLTEITAAKFQPDEEEDLEAEHKRLANAQDLSTGTHQAYLAIYGADRSVVGTLGSVGAELKRLARLDPDLKPVVERLEESGYLLEEVGRELMSYSDGMVFDPHRQSEVEDRLALITRLKRKHPEVDGLAGILAKAEEMAAELETLSAMESRISGLEAELQTAAAELERLAGELSEARQEAAERLDRTMVDELAELNMNGAGFETSLVPREIGRDGREKAVFMLSANPGEPLKPLTKVASGGELSRLTLALKSVLVETVGVETIIFDEVDAGIGGRVAEVVGRKLKGLAARQQILCITHLPQIAAFGRTHYRVSKEVSEGRTASTITALSDDDRVAEMARMLGGSESSQKALAHAREMLTKAG